MSKIDHRAEATERLEFAVNTPHESMADFALAQAQVSATLYLAEQQRVANLIAYARDARASGFGVPLEILDDLNHSLGLTIDL